MKKLFLSLIILFASATLFAQSKLSDEQKQEILAKYEAYRTKLNLTDEQAPKVREYNMAYFEKLISIRRSDNSSMYKLRELKGLNAQHDKEMKGVLTAEQYKIYQQQQKETKEDLMESRKKN